MIKILISGIALVALTGCATTDIQKNLTDITGYKFQKVQPEEVQTTSKKVAVEDVKVKKETVKAKPVVSFGTIVEVRLFNEGVKPKIVKMAEVTIVTDQQQRIVLSLPNKGFKASQKVVVTSEEGKTPIIDVVG